MPRPARFRDATLEHRRLILAELGITADKPASGEAALVAAEKIIPFDPFKQRRNNAKKFLADWESDGTTEALFQYRLPGSVSWKSMEPDRLIRNAKNEISTVGLAGPEFFEDEAKRSQANADLVNKANEATQEIARHYRKWWDQERAAGRSVLALNWPTCVRETLASSPIAGAA